MANSHAQKTQSRAWPPAFISSDFLVGEMRKQSIDKFAQRSDRKVLTVTYYFALGGAFANIISHALGSVSVHVGLFWGLWIPFCCVMIPAVHFLSRQIVMLRERLDALETRVEVSAQSSEKRVCE